MARKVRRPAAPVHNEHVPDQEALDRVAPVQMCNIPVPAQLGVRYPAAGGWPVPVEICDVSDQPGDQGGSQGMQLDIPGLGEGQCPFYFLDPCIITYPQSWLGNGQSARPGNVKIRHSLYRRFWGTMNNMGAWQLELYLQKKGVNGRI